MGLRIVTHYWDRSEALIARGVLQQAGFYAVITNLEWLSNQSHFIGAHGGYELAVPEAECDEAVAVLRAAMVEQPADGEVLEVTGDFLDRVLSFALGLLSNVPTPLRRRVWRDV